MGIQTFEYGKSPSTPSKSKKKKNVIKQQVVKTVEELALNSSLVNIDTSRIPRVMLSGKPSEGTPPVGRLESGKAQTGLC